MKVMMNHENCTNCETMLSDLIDDWSAETYDKTQEALIEIHSVDTNGHGATLHE